MSTSKYMDMFRKVDELEYRYCVYFNRHCHQYRPMMRYFRAMSRLGDGVFWYALMTVLPLFHGLKGFQVGITMCLVALFNVFVYKKLKQTFVRERPYISYDMIEAGTPALDRYSFPSGHTLHAVCFTLMCCYFFPAWAVLLVPMMLSIAASRVVLGLHYPTDVLVGALMGVLVGTTGIALIMILFM